jgi:hypothetical protein
MSKPVQIRRNPIKRALLIGIDYIGTPNQLYGCINDINSVRTYITTNCNYKLSDIRILSDNSIKPTMVNIKRSIEWLISGIQPGDSLLLHYSGHGTSILDKNNDESDRRDEAIIPLDYMTSGILSDDWIYENLSKRVPLNVKLNAFFDCCCSGTMCDLKYNIKYNVQPKTPTTALIDTYKSDDWLNNFYLSYEKTNDVVGNIIMFSGCFDNQYAGETVINDKPQGVFTKTLLDALTSNKNKLFTYMDLLKEVNCRIVYTGYKNQFSQISISKLQLLNTNFSL